MRVEIVAVVSLALALTGCDPDVFTSQRKTKAEEIRQNAERQEQRETAEKEETAGERAALEQFVSVQERLPEEEVAATKILLAGLTGDQEILSRQIGILSEKSISDKNGARETALYEMLKDEGVNKIARAHLGTDFSVFRAEFAEKVRHAMKTEKERRDALSRNEAAFKSSVEDARAKSAAMREGASRAAAGIQREISQLQSKKQKLQNELNFAVVSPTRTGNIKQEIRSVDTRLSSLQNQYNEMRLVESRSQIGARGDAATEFVRNQALREKIAADKEVKNGLGDAMSPFEIAASYEEQTIRKLDAVLREKGLSFREKISLLNKRISFLKLSGTGLEKLNLTGLKRLRATIDAELAKGAVRGR